MRILIFGEYNIGGGAKSNINLALSASKFAQVAFQGIDHFYPEYPSIYFIKTRARNPISFRYFIDFINALKEFNPHIVHATGMYTGLITLLAKYLTRKRIKIILTLRHTSTKFRFHFLAKRLVTFLNKVDAVHYLTDYQRVKYQTFGLRPNVFYIIPNIVFVHSYSQDEVNALRRSLITQVSANWLIVFVGRLIESKQVDIFVRTIECINKLGFNTGGVIVGTGEKLYLESLKDLSKKLGIDSKMVFAGFSDQPELYIKACDFCLFPTMWDEALPRFILESFSKQKTMVVSNHPSISCIVEDHLDALVSENHTAQGYADNCIELLGHPQLLKKLEQEAWNKFNRLYKAEVVINEYNKMYQNTMKE